MHRLWFYKRPITPLKISGRTDERTHTTRNQSCVFTDTHHFSFYRRSKNCSYVHTCKLDFAKTNCIMLTWFAITSDNVDINNYAIWLAMHSKHVMHAYCRKPVQIDDWISSSIIDFCSFGHECLMPSQMAMPRLVKLASNSIEGGYQTYSISVQGGYQNSSINIQGGYQNS